MVRIGYARVSTTDHDLDTQPAKPRAEGCEAIRSEKVSGATREDSTQLATVLDFLRIGNEFMVTRFDRPDRIRATFLT